MADNILVTPGTGATIAADDIGGVLHQRVKLSQGADGVGVDVSSAAPLQVTLANTGANATAVKVDGSAVTQPVSGSVSISGTPTVSGTVAVSTINSVAPAFGTGVRGATVQRVTISTDDVVPITDNGGSLTVDYNGSAISTSNALPVQPPASGNFPVSQSGTWTVQPGNTANTVAWKVDGSAVTQPVSGTVTANAGTGTMAVSMATNTPLGTVAHDSADSGAPIKTGGRAVSAEITPVTTGDRTDSIHDLAGKQVVMPYANNENFVSGAITTAMTGTTSTSLVAAPAAGLRNYITTIIVSNSHATVGTDVIIQDGSGGTTLLTIPAAAVYGGAVINLPVPLRQPTTATAIFCANVTTGASTKVSAVGYKGY